MYNNSIDDVLYRYVVYYVRKRRSSAEITIREHYAVRTLRIKTRRKDGGKGCRNMGPTRRDNILYCCYYYYNIRGMRPYTFGHNKDERLLYYYQRVVYGDANACVRSI